MVTCKPKKSTYITLALVIIILMAGLSYLLYDFYHNSTFHFLFYMIGCTLITVVLLMILVKMMAGYKFIAAGKDKIEIWLPFKGYRKTYPVKDVLAWQEEEIMANKRTFRQLVIVFTDKASFSVSNHEHLGYEELKRYFMKKIPKKKVKN
jgi:hypothetical protein